MNAIGLKYPEFVQATQILGEMKRWVGALRSPPGLNARADRPAVA